ncbi:MAG: hypothetical protein U5M51_00160 [Emticicia sp.]|nr:hypothetical protein [Emticicia sp.]
MHQVFKESYDAKECFNEPFIRQKLDWAAFRYMHKNPVSGRFSFHHGLRFSRDPDGVPCWALV